MEALLDIALNIIEVIGWIIGAAIVVLVIVSPSSGGNYHGGRPGDGDGGE